MNRTKVKTHTIEVPDFKEHDDAGPWRTYALYTEGETLEECLNNASYFITDQDGGEMGACKADDNEAQEYIEQYFREKGVS